MDINRIICAYFSPTGGTKRVAMALQNGFLQGLPHYKPQVLTYNYLTPERRAKAPVFSAHDLLVLASPVYYGRMPWAFAQWPELQGNGARAIVVSVYGNRAIEDGTRETAAFLQAHGFKVGGYIEAIAEHSLERRLASGRPDANDKAQLTSKAQEILKLLCKLQEQHEEWAEYDFDFNTPYKAAGRAAIIPHPLDTAKCDSCQRCIKMCPCGIIDPETFTVKDEDREQCMNCTACMKVCLSGVRGYTSEEEQALRSKMTMIYEANQKPKPIAMVLAS